MSSRDFTVEELAAYHHLMPQHVLKMASRDKLPGRRVLGQWKFSEAEIHHWMEDRIGVGNVEDLHKVETLLHRSKSSQKPVALTDFLFEEAIAIPLEARTRGSVIRKMCDLAASTGLLWDAEEMVDAVSAREDLHPTALENGVAMLHPRRPRASILAQPLIAMGISSQSIPFGNRAGHLTDVFFLICSTDDSIHLKILARLSRMVADSSWLAQLRACESPRHLMQLMGEGESSLAPVSL